MSVRPKPSAPSAAPRLRDKLDTLRADLADAIMGVHARIDGLCAEADTANKQENSRSTQHPPPPSS